MVDHGWDNKSRNTYRLKLSVRSISRLLAQNEHPHKLPSPLNSESLV